MLKIDIIIDIPKFLHRIDRKNVVLLHVIERFTLSLVA